MRFLERNGKQILVLSQTCLEVLELSETRLQQVSLRRRSLMFPRVVKIESGPRRHKLIVTQCVGG